MEKHDCTWKINVDKTKPLTQWKVEHFADIGTSEEFVQQLMVEMSDLIGATMIPDPQREEV